MPTAVAFLTPMVFCGMVEFFVLEFSMGSIAEQGMKEMIWKIDLLPVESSDQAGLKPVFLWATLSYSSQSGVRS